MRYFAAGLLLLGSCSSVRSVYLQRGYDVLGNSPIKRVTVATWAPVEATKLAETMGAVASDLLKLRKNYLVYEPVVAKQSWSEACTGKVEGVLMVRALDVQPRGSRVFLSLVSELYRCSNGSLVWRATADGAEAPTDNDLAQLTSSYAGKLGEAASHYAAPTFVLLQQLVESLPNPTLNDDDVQEKIELGAL